MTSATLRLLAVGLAAGASIVIGAVAVIPAAVQLELYYLPPKTQWEPLIVTTDGRDLVVSGTVVKPRNCGFEGPLGRDVAPPYKWVPVVSESETLGQTWPAGPEPKWFGPWRFVGAAHKEVDVYQTHWCHRFWPLTTYLGRVKAQE